MDTARYYVALGMVVATMPILFSWFLVHPFIEMWRRVGLWGTYVVIIGFIAIGIMALWSTRNLFLTVDFGFNVPLSVLAAVLLCGAMIIRTGWRKVLRPGTVLGIPEISGRRDRNELVTDGIYSVIRHPRYVEVGLGLLAAALFSNYLASYVVVLGYVVFVYLVVLLEERELRKRFGKEYEDYCSRVPRFIPRMRSRSPKRDGGK
ncbi:MAG: isoprenylcysteine carboxylmethyltransferase family protein [bacterium]|nr:MAG: isoprenylcysteine carboxylmethyltransferase family protein [bacterium]